MQNEHTLNWLMDLVANAKSENTDEAKKNVVSSVPTSLVESLMHDAASSESSKELEVIGTGIAASPGAAAGIVCFSSESVLDVTDKGEKAVLVCNETSPADEVGMRMAEGIVTVRGGMASHAAVVARGWGIPAVVGVSDLEIADGNMKIRGVVVKEGDYVSLDGSTGEVFSGEMELQESNEEISELKTLLDWADEVRSGFIKIRANADTAEDARRALAFGAEGIGLCRTEHMFMGDRLPLIQRFILADKESEEEKESLNELMLAQRSDLAEVIAAMAPNPVTIRLLDAPLHEFLGTETPDELSEHNPMLGPRGVRLAIIREQLYRMQTRALIGALVDVAEAGKKPNADIMVPLVSEVNELNLVRSWIEEEIASVENELRPSIGTMIETPRAAITAESIANKADFFSFGTNDLTQLLFGFSRDDIESRVISVYVKEGILSANPFETLDTQGVGHAIRHAIENGRKTNPELEIGVCGEHGGDPESIRFLFERGVDYVSCSPFRVPIARLAAAQAVLSLSD